VTEYGEDPAVVACLRFRRELAEDAGVGPAFGHQREDLALARGQARQAGAARAEELADYLRVEGGAAARDAFQRGDEFRDVRDAVLEEVADAFGAPSVPCCAALGSAVSAAANAAKARISPAVRVTAVSTAALAARLCRRSVW
jgi:hypothetical protein